MNIWEKFSVKDKQCYQNQIGPLKIWIQRLNDEWLIASDRVSGEYEVTNSELLDQIPDGLEWNRYVLPQKDIHIELTPVTPEKSVVVRPESTLKILTGAEALFYVLIPVWVRISAGLQNKYLLTELPSQILSNTWFGEPHEGELCYFLKTTARRSLENLVSRPHQAVCPVYVKNTSASDLDFTRLCIRTEFLSIYKAKSWLWTNTVHVQFRGVSQTSKIKYDNETPDFEPESKLISKPRSKPVKEFSFKTFDTFKVFTGG